MPVLRSAVIDIGSNSVRLVVYEGAARAPAVIFNEKVPAGLGRGLAIDGAIAPEDAARGLAALRRYALLARQMEVGDLQCVATAAVRDATNGADFMAGAAEAGLEIRLLSGAEEAEAAGCGVLAAIPDAHGIAVDLGGGSLE
ncbi:MAG: Ppx/GppA family phosphatase, partial [Sphingopyxis granuli]